MEIQEAEGVEITFGPQDDRALLRPHNNVLVMKIDVARVWVALTFVDMGTYVNVMYFDCWSHLAIEIELQPPMGSLFSGEMILPVGTVCLPVTLGSLAVGIN